MTDNVTLRPGGAAQGLSSVTDGANAASGYKVGIDIGSTTIKVVVLDA